MRRLLNFRPAILCLLLLYAVLSAYAQDSTSVMQVKKIENQLSGILEKNDVDALDKLLHPQFTVQSNEGNVLKKAQLLEGFRNGGNPYLRFRPQASSVVVVDANTVITSGKEIYAHKTDDHPGQDQTRYFYHVWVKYNNQWMLAGRVVADSPK